MRVTLVGASIVRESELPGFESVTDFASESFNLAIASLKAAVLQEPELAPRIDVTLLDFGIGWDRKNLGQREARAVLDTNPDVVGLSCYCWSVDTLLELAHSLSDGAKRPFVLLGGPSAGPIAHDLMTAHGCVDAVAVGEGERTFTELLRALDRRIELSEVPGLVYRGPDGVPIASTAPDSAVSLERLASPYRTGVLNPSRSMLIETSRGCRFRCKFCSWMGGGSKLRYVPVESVEADLRWAVAHGIRDIKLADTAINFHTDRVRELAGAIRRADPQGTLRFTYFLKPELLTEEQAECLRGIAVEEIIIGVESLTDAARRAVGKPPFDPAQFEHTIGLLQSIGPVTASLILGLPGDSEQGLRHTLEWMTSFDRAHPGALHVTCLFWLALLPGANLHANRDSNGFRVAPRETPYVLESRTFDPDRLLVMARDSIELHYQHPGLRVEYFHKEYLMQDAPAAERHVQIERRGDDSRACVLLVGLVDPETQAIHGITPYSLEIAWMKAFAEKEQSIRQSTRIELLHVNARETEIASAVEVIRKYAPRAVVVSQSACAAAFTDALIERLGSELPGTTLLACNGSKDERAWLERASSLRGVFTGEPEVAFRRWLAAGMTLDSAAGMMVRRGAAIEDGGPAQVIENLDELPSPLQWGFVQRAGASIAMRWSRQPSPSSPGAARVFSPERVYGDLRWAIEQRHEHIVWLDNELPLIPSLLRGFVETLQRADPEGRIRHAYAVSPAGLTDEIVEVLAGIPTREIRICRPPDSEQERSRLAKLCERAGARLAGPPQRTRPDLESILHPWRLGAVIEHWRLDAIEALPGTEGAASLQFTWGDGSRATVTLVPDTTDRPAGTPAWRASLALHEGESGPPEEAVRRLTQMISTILDSARRKAAMGRRTRE